jgi:hypothetical protein
VPLRAASARNLGGRALRVLIAIAGHAGAEGIAYPSLARIAQHTGIAREKIPALITKLVSAGLIRREKRWDDAGDPAVNLYTILLGEGVSPQRETPGVPGQGDTVSPPKRTRGVPASGDLTDQSLTDHPTEERGGKRVGRETRDHPRIASRPPPDGFGGHLRSRPGGLVETALRAVAAARREEIEP